MAKVSSLFIYPLKSAQGIAQKSLEVINSGPRRDREWMLVDSNGNFVSQRVQPRMSQIHTQLSSDSLVVSAQGFPHLQIPFADWGQNNLEVKLFGKSTQGVWLGSSYDQWFSDYLGGSFRLIRSPQQQSRETSGNHGPKTEILFADGYPFLLTNAATLAELNAKMESPISMARFRPNIVIEGCSANEEQNWKKIKIGNVEFLSVKPCTRCVVINIDPTTGNKSNTVTKTLAGYRTREGQVIFGENLSHLKNGTIQVGDNVQVENSIPIS